MAINQVINLQNRVVEYPNRYKLTQVAGTNDTYDLERQPGEITEVGTPYARNIINKIDNVLSYLKLNLTQEEETGLHTYNNTLKWTNFINTALTSFDNTYYDIGTIRFGTNYDVNVRGKAWGSKRTSNGVYIKNGLFNLFEGYSGTGGSSNGTPGIFTFSNYGVNTEIVFDKKIKLKTFDIYASTNRSTSSISAEYWIYNDDTLIAHKAFTTKGTLNEDLQEFTDINKIQLFYSSNDDYDANLSMKIKEFQVIDTAKLNKFELGTLTNTLIDNQRVLIETPSVIDYTDITQNKINNTLIESLLDPGKKYELVYNEEEDKFKIGKLTDSILYDITLTQQVNQIDLTGISDKLKLDKTYCMIVQGTATTASNICLGTDNFGYLYAGGSSSNSRNSTAFFAPYLYNGIKYIAGFASSISGAANLLSQIQNAEYLKLAGASYKFNEGTRIIIKEVC